MARRADPTEWPVWGWSGFRRECPPAPNGSRQTREICCAPSMAAAARAVGKKRASELSNICETFNETEVALARAKPGVVFWSALSSGRRYRESKT